GDGHVLVVVVGVVDAVQSAFVEATVVVASGDVGFAEAGLNDRGRAGHHVAAEVGRAAVDVEDGGDVQLHRRVEGAGACFRLNVDAHRTGEVRIRGCHRLTRHGNRGRDGRGGQHSAAAVGGDHQVGSADVAGQ